MLYPQEGKTALYWAIEKGHNEIVQLLLDNDPDIEISNKVSNKMVKNMSHIMRKPVYAHMLI